MAEKQIRSGQMDGAEWVWQQDGPRLRCCRQWPRGQPLAWESRLRVRTGEKGEFRMSTSYCRAGPLSPAPGSATRQTLSSVSRRSVAGAKKDWPVRPEVGGEGGRGGSESGLGGYSAGVLSCIDAQTLTLRCGLWARLWLSCGGKPKRKGCSDARVQRGGRVGKRARACTPTIAGVVTVASSDSVPRAGATAPGGGSPVTRALRNSAFKRFTMKNGIVKFPGMV